MLGILQHLTGNKNNIELGTVQEIVNKNKVFLVSVRGKELLLHSATNSVLKVGDQVIINSTDQDRYIIGTTKRLKTQKEKEVIING